MADLGKILNKVLPLRSDGSLPDPITRTEMERRLLAIAYPIRPVNGIDSALVIGGLQAMADFGLVRFTNGKGTGGATRVGSDLVYRTVTDFGPPATGFGPPPGHGTKETLIDENGKAHDFHIGADADAERQRIQRVRRSAYIEQIRKDLAEGVAV